MDKFPGPHYTSTSWSPTNKGWDYTESAVNLAVGDEITHPRTGRRIKLTDPGAGPNTGTYCYWWTLGTNGGVGVLVVARDTAITVHNRPNTIEGKK